MESDKIGHEPKPGGIAARAQAAARPTSYLGGLNPEQRTAIETVDGPVLVLAGAGTGKTRVLTTRIAHILATGRARAHEILAVTFTNKAAREMRERIGVLIGGGVEGMPWLGTFHAIGVKILRRHAELVGLKSNFTILDTDDQIRLMKQVIEADGIDEKRWPARQLAAQIDAWKNRGLTPTQVSAGEAAVFANGRGGKLYEGYQARLKALNACDFGDLLLECIRLFRENPSVLADYQRRFRYILVDEYQDTNVAQYLWLRLLSQRPAGEKPNLCCVGDDDQCLVQGTRIRMADGSEKAIEDIVVGDAVLSAHGGGAFGPAFVSRTYRRDHAGELVEIEMADGTRLVSTPEHRHFAGYRLGEAPQLHFTYLMHKRGYGFRLGTSQTYTRGQIRPVLGFEQRCRGEHADALWILSTHPSENEARYHETVLSLDHGIPTLPFVARPGSSTNGVVHDQAILDRLFAERATDAAADRLLSFFGLSRAFPHYRPQSHSGRRRNVMVTLCGERRDRSPLHRISIIGSDPADAELLRGLGLSVRPVKKANAGWRYETSMADLPALMAIVESIRAAFDDDVAVVQYGRFGRGVAEEPAQCREATQDGEVAVAVQPVLRTRSSLPMMPASSVRVGMSMFRADGSLSTVQAVRSIGGGAAVYDLDITRTHNFIANGIVTHNSIYAWRGAEVDNILRFEKDFPGAVVVRLERNYRSTGHILAAASHLIAHNEGRLGKTLFTDDEMGEKVTVAGAWDSGEEARAIGDEIEALQRHGERLDDMAILVRASFQMREFEDRFVTLGLPYRVIGGPRFYERAEIRDALAYFRCVMQPADDLAFERIVNVPKRGLGDATIQMLHDHARRTGTPMMQAARVLVETEELKPKARQTLRDLMASFSRWAMQVETLTHQELAELILEESGYTEMWQKDRSAEAAGRLENLKELVRSMEGFENMAGFLEHIALVMDTTEASSEDKVSIMTLHAAKGLEFDTVFLPGWEEALFPHPRALDENGRAGLEEERRLAYVGLTRARRRAKVWFATNRRIHGLWQSTMPSRFIDELPEAHVEVTPASSGFGSGASLGMSRFDRAQPFAASSYSTPGWQRAQQAMAGGFRASQAPRREPLTIEGELIARSTGAPSAYAVGDRVFHLKFGYGRVTETDGNKLTVDFDKAGVKRVVDSFVERA